LKAFCPGKKSDNFLAFAIELFDKEVMAMKKGPLPDEAMRLSKNSKVDWRLNQ
jgi:hypothetical protein